MHKRNFEKFLQIYIHSNQIDNTLNPHSIDNCDFNHYTIKQMLTQDSCVLTCDPFTTFLSKPQSCKAKTNGKWKVAVKWNPSIDKYTKHVFCVFVYEPKSNISHTNPPIGNNKTPLR